MQVNPHQLLQICVIIRQNEAESEIYTAALDNRFGEGQVASALVFRKHSAFI